MQAEELEAASQMLADEMSKLAKQTGHVAVVDEQSIEAWQNALSEMIYLPSQHRYGRIASATNSDKIDSLQVHFLSTTAFLKANGVLLDHDQANGAYSPRHVQLNLCTGWALYQSFVSCSSSIQQYSRR